jgi:TfoX/Sxy family transcriptional regulator of competence genes
MSREYQLRLTNFLDEHYIAAPPKVELQVKPFFGGAAAYANGAICLTLTKVGFAVKLPDGDLKTLFDLGAQPLRYFPKAPIKKQYALLPQEIMNNPENLRYWIEKCISHVVKKEK